MKYWCSTTVKSCDTVALKDEHIRILRTAHSKSCCHAALSHIARPRVSWLINTCSLCSSTQEYQWDLACFQAQKDLQHVSVVMLHWNETHMDFRACNLMCELFVCFFSTTQFTYSHLETSKPAKVYISFSECGVIPMKVYSEGQVLVIFSKLMLWIYNQFKINAVKRYISKVSFFWSSAVDCEMSKCFHSDFTQHHFISQDYSAQKD